jgi:succinate dehydrogenase / fumarate reductase cytochrome b subunit
VRRYLGLLFSYRGREGTLAWAFHRISGVGVWAFVVIHVLDIYLVGGDPVLYDELLEFYASTPGRLLEVVLGAGLLYHALNGLRIIIIDLWPAMTVYHRQLWWASWVIFVVVGLPGAAIILRPLWRGAVDDLLRSAGVL